MDRANSVVIGGLIPEKQSGLGEGADAGAGADAASGLVGRKRSLSAHATERGDEAEAEAVNTTMSARDARLQSMAHLVRHHQALLRSLSVLECAEYVDQEVSSLRQAESDRVMYGTRARRNKSGRAGRRTKSSSGGSGEEEEEEEEGKGNQAILAMSPLAQYEHFAAIYYKALSADQVS